MCYTHLEVFAFFYLKESNVEQRTFCLKFRKKENSLNFLTNHKLISLFLETINKYLFFIFKNKKKRKDEKIDSSLMNSSHLF